MVIILPFIIGVLWLVINVQFLRRMTIQSHSNPSISVLIPLRDEATNVQRLMKNLHNIDYEQAEFLFYDDQSTDGTAALLQENQSLDTRFRLLYGDALPSDWHGKPHACQRLAEQAKGDILVWIDADVTLHPKALLATATMFERPIDALSGFPRFDMRNWLEKLLTPLLHFFVHVHLPIYLANRQCMPAATAASGAFIAVRRDAYFEIGGHTAVKDEVVEDVALFRMLKKSGRRAMLYNITDFVSCAMYATVRDTWQGFQKNCFRGIQHSYVLGCLLILFYSMYFVMPGVLFIIGLSTQHLLYTWPFICITAMRLVSDYVAKQLSIFSLLMPVSACAYCVLLGTTMIQTARKKSMYWKGRKL